MLASDRAVGLCGLVQQKRCVGQTTPFLAGSVRERSVSSSVGGQGRLGHPGCVGGQGAGWKDRARFYLLATVPVRISLDERKPAGK